MHVQQTKTHFSAELGPCRSHVPCLVLSTYATRPARRDFRSAWFLTPHNEWRCEADVAAGLFRQGAEAGAEAGGTAEASHTPDIVDQRVDAAAYLVEA